MREELPVHNAGNVLAFQISHPNRQTDIVTHFFDRTQLKDMTFPQQIREMMQLAFSELNYSRKTPGNELVQLIEDRRFCKIMSTELHKHHLGNWEAPLPFKRDDVNLPNNRERCMKRLLSLKKKLSNDQKAKENYVDFMQKIFDRQHASRVPVDELTGPSGKVWYLPHFDIYHPKKPNQERVVFDCSAVFCNESLNRNLLQGPDQLKKKQMFHSFYVNPASRDFLRFLWFENNDLNGPVVEFRMNVNLFGAISSPAVANYCLHKTAERMVVLSLTRLQIFSVGTFMSMTASLPTLLFQRLLGWLRTVKPSVRLQSYEFTSSLVIVRMSWKHFPRMTE